MPKSIKINQRIFETNLFVVPTVYLLFGFGYRFFLKNFFFYKIKKKFKYYFYLLFSNKLKKDANKFKNIEYLCEFAFVLKS